MTQDLITRSLAEITDYVSFERFCNNLMAVQGYYNMEPLGGVHDSGRDALQVARNDGGDTKVFAYSVRKDWQIKLFADAEAIRDNDIDCTDLVFVCTAQFTTNERDVTVAKIKQQFGWTLHLYGIERIRQLLAERPDLIGYHPAIFPFGPARELQAGSSEVHSAEVPPSWPRSTVRQGSSDELCRTEMANDQWARETGSFHFQQLLRAIREIEQPAGRLQAGRTVREAVQRCGALTNAAGPVLLRVCEELNSTPIFQLNWKLRRMFARVVGLQLGQSDVHDIGKFCEAQLSTSRGLLLLAEAATEHARAASAIGSTILRQLLKAKEPQVPWQLLKRWPIVSPIVNEDLPLDEIFEASHGVVRRRLFITRLLTARSSSAALRRLLDELSAFAGVKSDSNPDVRFRDAFVAWARTNTCEGGAGKSSPLPKVHELLYFVPSGPTQRLALIEKVPHVLEVDAIERDLWLAEGRYHYHSSESFSEGRYDYIRHYIRLAISIAPPDYVAPLLLDLLSCANEGIRWAVAAELPNWWVLVPDSETANNITLQLIGDDHPWVVREVLHRLADDQVLCQSIGVTRLLVGADESRRMIETAGWQTGELVEAIRRLAALKAAA